MRKNVGKMLIAIALLVSGIVGAMYFHTAGFAWYFLPLAYFGYGLWSLCVDSNFDSKPPSTLGVYLAGNWMFIFMAFAGMAFSLLRKDVVSAEMVTAYGINAAVALVAFVAPFYASVYPRRKPLINLS